MRRRMRRTMRMNEAKFETRVILDGVSFFFSFLFFWTAIDVLLHKCTCVMLLETGPIVFLLSFFMIDSLLRDVWLGSPRQDAGSHQFNSRK